MPWIDNRDAVDLPDDGITQLLYLGTTPTGNYTDPEHGSHAPQAFKVANGPKWGPLRTHFHTVNQFQFIASGTGKVGAHPVHRGEVHYADRFTPYGPLYAGPEGFAYITLRPTTDTGISYMPDARDELRDRLAGSERAASDRRSLTLDLTDPAVVGTDEGTWTDVVADDDELRVAAATVAPGAALDTPQVGGDGAYLVVLDGTLDDEGTPRAPGSLRWCEPGEQVHLTAGPEGVRVAHLQFPRS